MSTNPTIETRIRACDAEAIAEAGDLICAGACVAIPTETVYGLAADATNGVAVAGVYAAKGRPPFNPLIVHVASLERAQELVLMSPQACQLAEEHWPGPLTLVLPARKNNGIAALVTAGLSTLAIRIPAHRAMRDLLLACERPLAAPSANASGRISPTSAAHVFTSLAGRIPLILDDGPTSVGLESTIIGFGDDGKKRLLRPGPIDFGLQLNAHLEISAPGQLSSHYAPTKPMRLNAVVAQPDEFLIGFGDVRGEITLSANGNLLEAAAELFAALHIAQAATPQHIAVAPIPSIGLGLAINDRLRRAAA